MTFPIGDGFADAMLCVEEEIESACLSGQRWPESSLGHYRENRGEVRDSFSGVGKQVVNPSPPYSGTWDCIACGKSFGFAQLSEQGYCYDDQVIHLTLQEERERRGTPT